MIISNVAYVHDTLTKLKSLKYAFKYNTLLKAR